MQSARVDTTHPPVSYPKLKAIFTGPPALSPSTTESYLYSHQMLVTYLTTRLFTDETSLRVCFGGFGMCLDDRLFWETFCFLLGA